MTVAKVATLAEFLLARIAEDEAVARAATVGPWRWDNDEFGDDSAGPCQHSTEWTDHGPDLVTVAEQDNWSQYSGSYKTPVATVISATGYDASAVNVNRADAEHIARHDPARVLAECDAKRRIVEGAEAIMGHEKTYAERMRHSSTEDATYVIARDMLRSLALPYASHPDYDESWRP